jgi:hypothetical protein
VLNIFTDFREEHESVTVYVYIPSESIACLNINLLEATVANTAKVRNSELIILRLAFFCSTGAREHHKVHPTKVFVSTA